MFKSFAVLLTMFERQSYFDSSTKIIFGFVSS